jgi:hypothetical protein
MNLTLEETIRVTLQNRVKELYYNVEGICESDIESIVADLSESIKQIVNK